MPVEKARRLLRWRLLLLWLSMAAGCGPSASLSIDDDGRKLDVERVVVTLQERAERLAFTVRAYLEHDEDVIDDEVTFAVFFALDSSVSQGAELALAGTARREAPTPSWGPPVTFEPREPSSKVKELWLYTECFGCQTSEGEDHDGDLVLRRSGDLLLGDLFLRTKERFLGNVTVSGTFTVMLDAL